MNTSAQSPRTTSSYAASAATLETQHNAAWERFEAIQSRINQGDHSPAAQAEYKAATDAVLRARGDNAGGIYKGGL